MRGETNETVSNLNREEETTDLRWLAAVMLTGMIATCPTFCGAGEVGHSVCGKEAGGADCPKCPSPCPGAGDNCICQGAVTQSDLRPVDVQPFDGLVILAELAAHTPLHPLPHLTWNGRSTNLTGAASAGIVCARLQNFRC